MDLKTRWDWWTKKTSKSKVPFFGTGPRVMLAITFFVLGVDILFNGPAGMMFQFGNTSKLRLLNPIFLGIGWLVMSAIFTYLAINPSKEDISFRKTRRSLIIDIIFYIVFGVALTVFLFTKFFI